MDRSEGGRLCWLFRGRNRVFLLLCLDFFLRKTKNIKEDKHITHLKLLHYQNRCQIETITIRQLFLWCNYPDPETITIPKLFRGRNNHDQATITIPKLFQRCNYHDPETIPEVQLSRSRNYSRGATITIRQLFQERNNHLHAIITLTQQLPCENCFLITSTNRFLCWDRNKQENQHGSETVRQS